MATYTINFNSANGTDVATHNASLSPSSSGLTCDTNECYGSGIVLHSATFSGDQYVQCVARNIDTNNVQLYLHAMAASSVDAVVAMVRANRVILYDYVGGPNTNVSTTVAAGDVVRLEVSGTTAVVKVNGTTVATLTGITRTGTKIGFGGADAASRLDDIEFGDLVASTPTAPTSGSASSVAITSATANWTDNSSDETGFKVQYSPSPYSSWTSASGSPAAANATSLSVTGLSQGTTYKFRVAATNGAGDSSWSESSAFSTPTRKLRVSGVHPDAASDTGVAGVVFAAPSGSDITGARIGEFTGAAFDGSAILKVACSAFGGGSLTTSDTPRVYLQNSADCSPIISATVIDE